MAIPVSKRFRGYIAPALLAYTVLVTFLLVQTAWNDGGAVRKKRSQEAVHRYVPSKEERRYLLRLEDVDGNAAQDRRDRALSNDGRGNFRALQNGRKVQSSLNNDFYVDEVGNNNNNNNNSNSNSNNRSLADGIFPPGGRDYILESRQHKFRGDAEGKQEIKGDGVMDFMLDAGKNNQMQQANIEIEERIPGADNESSSSYNKAVIKFRHHSSRDKRAGDSSKTGGSSNAKERQDSSQRSSGQPDTHFCDNIDEDGKSCYRDRIGYSHPNHVNISSSHQSFRGFGGLYIYSAFLDTRQRPASIRVMTIGPRGYQNEGSSLWCAFSTPLAMSKRFRWTGQEEDNIAMGRTQASQLYFYAASDGHQKSKQFYVLSCQVPDSYLKTLLRFDGNRIDIVAGTRDDALLDTIQERTPITVINNKGLPWHVLKEQATLARGSKSDASIDDKAKSVPDNRSESTFNKPDYNVNDNWIKKGSEIVQSINELGLISDNLASEKIPNAGGTPTGMGAFASGGPKGGRDAIVSCVAPVYGLTGIVQVTEFIELNLLLGVQHIVLYAYRVSPDVRQILHRYKDEGLVTVMPWNIPDTMDIWARGRDAALNDCLYRAMFLYDFALFHDADEFLVPKATPDLPSLLGFLRTKGKLNTTKISDIVFNSAYFPPPTKKEFANLTNMTGFTKDVTKFVSLRCLHRSYFSSHHTLRIIKPVAAMRVGAGERKRTTFYINPRFAGVNHYAKCPPAQTPDGNASSGQAGHRDKSESSKNGQPTVDCIHTKWDDVSWRFKDKLIQNTKDSIRAFNAQPRERKGRR